MKKLLKTKAVALITLFLVLAAASSTRAIAQNPDEGPPPPDAPQGRQEGDWIRALNLSPDQVARIREIREQNKEARQDTHRRLVQAQRALDEAIYADEANEGVIDQRVRELASAQAAEVRLRATTELSIRRVLTPQQLSLFRELRAQRMRDARMRRRTETRQGPDGGEGGIGSRPGGGGRGGVFPRRIRP